MVRVTTGGILRSYRSNLNRSTQNQWNAMNLVLTQRKFTSFGDSPSDALRSFQLHTSLSRTQDQIKNSSTTISKFQAAEDSLDSMCEQFREELSASMMAENPPTGSGVPALSKTLTGLADSMVKTLNSQYGDSYVFAGADGKNVPFEYKEVTGAIDAWDMDAVTWQAGTSAGEFTADISMSDLGGYSQKTHTLSFSYTDSTGATQTKEISFKTGSTAQATADNLQAALSEDASLQELFDFSVDTETNPGTVTLKATAKEPAATGDQKATVSNLGTASTAQVDNSGTKIYYRGIDMATDNPEELAQLKAMSEETLYVDIGLGLTLNDDGTVIPSTAFNSAICGADVLGYGVDADGDPVDIISLAARLGDLYATADSDGNMSEEVKEESNRLFGKLKEYFSTLDENYTAIDTKSAYLKKNDDRITAQSDTIQTQIANNDQVDLADALTSLAWAQYAYNAALRAGNEILSQSFIDYMS